LYPLIYIQQSDMWRLVTMLPCSYFQLYWHHIPIHLCHMCSQAIQMLHLLLKIVTQIKLRPPACRTRKFKVL
jgi:hypothetical protein